MPLDQMERTSVEKAPNDYRRMSQSRLENRGKQADSRTASHLSPRRTGLAFCRSNVVHHQQSIRGNAVQKLSAEKSASIFPYGDHQ